MKLNKCENCGQEYSKGQKKCPNCGSSKKEFFFFFLIKMLILFEVLSTLTMVFASFFVYYPIINGKYGLSVLMEFSWCVLILIVMLCRKKSYVFTQKKEKFWKSVSLAIPILIITIFSLISSITELNGVNFSNLISLILYCVTIGMTEEFLCRGWLQNEFIEHFGKNRKQVILSIISASFVFGFMHISNIWNANQGVFETLLQIAQATSLGVLFGSIYYITKNIWSVAFLHGFYDFALMLSEVNSIRDCTTGVATNSIMIYQSIVSLFIIAFYAIFSALLLRKTKLNKVIDENYEASLEDQKKDEKKSKYLYIGLVVVTAFLFFPISPSIEGEEDYNICYHYEAKEIKEFEEHFPNHSKYFIKLEDYHFTLSYKEDNDELILKNDLTKDSVTFTYDDYIDSYEIIENSDNYIILISVSDDINSTVYYSKIMKEDLSNSKDFLKNVKESMKKYDLPLLSKIGYLTTEDSEYRFPYMKSGLGSKFMIDEEGNLYLL